MVDQRADVLQRVLLRHWSKLPVQERRRVKGALGALQDVVGGRRLPAAPRVQHRRQRVGLVGAPALPLRRPLGCEKPWGQSLDAGGGERPTLVLRQRLHAAGQPGPIQHDHGHICTYSSPAPRTAQESPQNPCATGPVTVLSAFSASRRRPARSSKEGRHGQHAIPARPGSGPALEAQLSVGP